MTSDIWTPFRCARQLVFGTLSFLCLVWACLFAALIGKGWHSWTSTEHGIVLLNVLSYTVGSVLFYLMAIVVFRLWWDYFRAGLLLILLSGASAAFTAFGPGLRCVLGTSLTCRRVYLITLSGSWFITGLLVCYCIALSGVTVFAGPFRSFPTRDNEKQHPIAVGCSYRISKPTPLELEAQTQLEPAISPRTQQNYLRMGLRIPSVPNRTHSSTISWYNVEEQALSNSSPRQSVSAIFVSRAPSRSPAFPSPARPLLPSFPPPSYPHYTHAHSASSLSYASSSNSISTEDGRAVIGRGAWAQLPQALSSTSHLSSGSQRNPHSLKRKPPPSLDTDNANANTDAGARPPTVNINAWMATPVHIIGSGPSVHSVIPSVASRRDESSVHPHRRRHPPSLTPGFTRDDWLSRRSRIERPGVVDPHSRRASLRNVPHDTGARF